MTAVDNSHPVLHRLRALIVEDDPADAELIVSELRRSGFEVFWERVETEEQYLARLAAGVPEIVLADYSLPQFNGSRALDKTTMNTYGSAFEKSKRRANSRVAALVLPPATKKQLKDRAKEVSLQNLKPETTAIE